MSNVDINVDRRTDGLTDRRTDGHKIGRLYRTLLQAGAIINDLKQDAQRPLLAHLSEITTADVSYADVLPTVTATNEMFLI